MILKINTADNRKLNTSVIIRACILILILGLSVFLYLYTDYSQYLTKDKIGSAIGSARNLVADFGLWGPVLFISASVIAITVNIPTVFIIYFSVIVFGGIAGLLISAVSAYIAISLIYFLARYLGRDFIAWLFKDKLKKLEKRLNEKGIKAVAYLRLFLFLLPPLNWALSLSNIRFSDYFLGTVLGSAHHMVINAWLSDIIIDLIAAGKSLNPIQSPKLLLPIGIGTLIFITIRIIDRRKH